MGSKGTYGQLIGTFEELIGSIRESVRACRLPKGTYGGLMVTYIYKHGQENANWLKKCAIDRKVSIFVQL